MKSNEITAIAFVVVGLLQIVFARRAGELTAKVTRWQLQQMERLFTDPKRAPTWSVVTGVVCVIFGVAAWVYGT